VNVYVETNFILELTLEQEQSSGCEQILQLCEVGKVSLLIPAYSFTEPHEKLRRQAIRRQELQKTLNIESQQLSRTSSYSNQIDLIQDVARLMSKSIEDERTRFNQCRERLLRVAEVISLSSAILSEAATCETTYGLTPQDSLIYASVIDHLRQDTPSQSCFLNRNFKDFDSPDIIDSLNVFNCRMIPRFDHGYRFVLSQVLG
jgi:predicted nucleic acid-binding protein